MAYLKRPETLGQEKIESNGKFLVIWKYWFIEIYLYFL